MLYKGDTLYLDWLEDGIAELVFDAPGSVNKLDTATVASLGEAIGVLEQQSDLKGLLLRSNKAAFIVGADITEFLSLFLVPEEQLSQRIAVDGSNGRHRQIFQAIKHAIGKLQPLT